MRHKTNPGLHYAPRKTQEEKIRQNYHRALKACEIIEYLEKFYEIVGPDGFSQKLDEAVAHSFNTGFSLSLATVDVIIQACQMWEDYVEDIDLLICHEVLSMAQIHVSVIWERSLLRDGFALKKEIPSTKETIVNHRGIFIALP